MFTALLDTCVLWPNLQRVFLLSLAFEGCYRFIFSEAILGELYECEVRKLSGSGPPTTDATERSLHLVNSIRHSFGDSLVTGWEGLEGSYGLPDPDDEHVVAAAVIGGAGNIVTDNVRDLQQDLMPEGITVISPADFAYETVSLRPLAAIEAITRMADRSGRNYARMTPHDILDSDSSAATRAALGLALHDQSASAADLHPVPRTDSLQRPQTR